MTFYDAFVKCSDLVGEAHGLDTLVKASKALEALVEEEKAELMSSCQSCKDAISHNTILWHDWEIYVSDFLSRFDSVEWKWSKSGLSMSKQQLGENLASHRKLQISLHEL
jgi:hypothetical protein